MCTVLLPPVVNPIAVNKYISYTLRYQVGIVEAPYNCLYLYVVMNMCTLQITTIRNPVSHFDIAVCFTVRVSKQKIRLVGYVAGQGNVGSVY